MRVVPYRTHLVEVCGLPFSKAEQLVTHSFAQLVCVKVQVLPCRLNVTGSDGSEAFDHDFVRFVFAETANVLFDEINSAWRDLYVCDSQFSNRCADFIRVELAAANVTDGSAAKRGSRMQITLGILPAALLRYFPAPSWRVAALVARARELFVAHFVMRRFVVRVAAFGAPLSAECFGVKADVCAVA